MEILHPSWRGRSLDTRKDQNGKYTAMVGNKSLLYIPVEVLPNVIYKITLEICNESGNGVIFCNIYGNRNFDFKQSKIECTENNWCAYDVDVITKDFPQNIPMVFKIFRGKEGTGNLLIRRIVVKLEDGPLIPNFNGKLVSTENLTSQSKHNTVISIPRTIVIDKLIDIPRSIKEKIYKTKALEKINTEFDHSCFHMQPTRILVVSELGDEKTVCDAFYSNGIECEGVVLHSDVQWLPTFISNKKINWVHFHIGRKTALTPQIIDQIRDVVFGIIITIWIEPGWPIFDNKLLEVLRCADVALMETELELTTYREAGCFNAELWDPGALIIISDLNGINHDVVLIGNNLEDHSELINTCSQHFGDRFIAIGTTNSDLQKVLCGAKVVVFADSQPSRILFGLLTAKLPVVAKRSISTLEWCKDKLDLCLFETPDGGVETIAQLLDNLDVAKVMSEHGSSTAVLHSAEMRAKELLIRLGCFEVVSSDLPKDRTSYASKRIFCAMRIVPDELITQGGDKDIDFMAASFTECRDLATKIIRFSPDILHIHLEADDDNLPWRDLLLDLRRRLPNMLTTVWHSGMPSIDRRIIDLSFSVDHIFIGDTTSAGQYHAMSLKDVEVWKPITPFGNSLEFRNNMITFARGMPDKRAAFLRSANGCSIDLTVFIGTFNRLELLKKAVETALTSVKSREVEIIVNDAGSTDGTQEWLHKKAQSNKRVVPIFSGKRTSFTQAFNESLQIAKGKYICWLSDDIISEKYALNDMCTVMDSITPMDMGGFCIKNSTRDEYMVRYGDGFYWPTVGCMYTETLRKLNGINMDYPYYSQDTDLDMRIYRLGGRIVAVKHCRLLHNFSNDELRISNINNHDNVMGNMKFVLTTWRLNEISRLPYPTILLIPVVDCSQDDILMVAHRIRLQYSNSHIFIAGETSENLDTRGPNSFLRKIPTINSRTPLLFSLVVKVEPNKTGILVRPSDQVNMPFVKHMLSGQL